MAAMPSTAARTNVSSVASTASAQNASRLGRVQRRERAAVTPGVDAGDDRGVVSAGTNCIATKRPAVAIGLSVWLEDDDRERNLAKPVAQLVDEVGDGEPTEARQGRGARVGRLGRT